MTTLRAMTETIPPDHTGIGWDPQSEMIEVQGATYVDALAAARAAVPDGRRIAWVRRGPQAAPEERTSSR